jgi:hypothetical protein
MTPTVHPKPTSETRDRSRPMGRPWSPADIQVRSAYHWTIVGGPATQRHKTRVVLRVHVYIMRCICIYVWYMPSLEYSNVLTARVRRLRPQHRFAKCSRQVIYNLHLLPRLTTRYCRITILFNKRLFFSEIGIIIRLWPINARSLFYYKVQISIFYNLTIKKSVGPCIYQPTK